MDLDYSNYLQFFLALIFVLGLIGLVTILLRHFGFGGALGPDRRLRSGKRRIEIIEVAPIDPRRRLVLIRRDNKEHLILLGMHDDILVEGGITPPESDEMPDSDTPSIGDSVRFGIKSFAASTRGTRK